MKKYIFIYMGGSAYREIGNLPCLSRSILLYNYQKKVLFYKINKNHQKNKYIFKDALRSNFKFNLELINHVTCPKLL
jgi:hypothetical protein